MEQSLDDLFNGAFSEVSAGFLENEDLDFDNMDFDSKFGEDVSQEDQPTEEDEALHQEAAGEATVLSNVEDEDMYVAENADKEQSGDASDEEDVRGVGTSVLSTDTAPQEDFTGSGSESEEGSSDPGDEGEEADTGAAEKPGDLLRSVRCSDEFAYGDKEGELFAVGQPLALEGTGVLEAGNEEQGESETHEQLSYFGQVPEQAKEMMIKGDGSEEDEQERQVESHEDSSDSESERVKIRRDKSVLALISEQEVESPYREEASLEFSEISVQHEQHLSVEADTDEYVGKMKDFSGEEHQEAGETFADYPSDFSSCEYVDGRRGNPDTDNAAKSLPCLERAATEITWTGEEEEADEEGDGCQYSRDPETGAHGVMGLDVATEESGKTKVETIEHGSDDGDQTAESDSYSSSDDDDDDDIQERKYDELSDNTCLLDSENYKKLELYSESGAAVCGPGVSDDHHESVADFSIKWDFKFGSLLGEDLLSTVDSGSRASYTSAHPAEDTGGYAAVQREDSQATPTSHRGSLDDGFFFNAEHMASGVSELGQLGDDEYEEERNWEQEKERIEAFYKFYDDDAEENLREERKTKVQFCADPLSQVIHYETDSSDRDSLSSSSEEEEEEEDLSSAETFEEPREPDDTLQRRPVHDRPDMELPHSAEQNEVSNTRTCTRKHKCGVILKQILKMGLVVLTGTLMFWLATDRTDWFGQMSFFYG